MLLQKTIENVAEAAALPLGTVAARESWDVEAGRALHTGCAVKIAADSWMITGTDSDIADSAVVGWGAFVPAAAVPAYVDTLAEAIRRVDGRHVLGAGALAEELIQDLCGDPQRADLHQP